MTWTGKTVLILEDEPIIAMCLEDMLLDNGDQKCYFGFEIQMGASIPVL